MSPVQNGNRYFMSNFDQYGKNIMVNLRLVEDLFMIKDCPEFSQCFKNFLTKISMLMCPVWFLFSRVRPAQRVKKGKSAFLLRKWENQNRSLFFKKS